MHFPHQCGRGGLQRVGTLGFIACGTLERAPDSRSRALGFGTYTGTNPRRYCPWPWRLPLDGVSNRCVGIPNKVDWVQSWSPPDSFSCLRTPLWYGGDCIGKVPQMWMQFSPNFVYLPAMCYRISFLSTKVFNFSERIKTTFFSPLPHEL